MSHGYLARRTTRRVQDYLGGSIEYKSTRPTIFAPASGYMSGFARWPWLTVY